METQYHTALATAGWIKPIQQGEFVFCQNYQASKRSDWTSNQNSRKPVSSQNISLGHLKNRSISSKNISYFAECNVAEIILKTWRCLNSHKCICMGNPYVNKTSYLFIVFGVDKKSENKKRISFGQCKCFGQHQERERWFTVWSAFIVLTKLIVLIFAEHSYCPQGQLSPTG